MVIYHTLRRLALVLRGLQVTAIKAADNAADAADNLGEKAKIAAFIAIARQEDKAYAAYRKTVAVTEAAIERLHEEQENAFDAFEEACEHGLNARQLIEREAI